MKNKWDSRQKSRMSAKKFSKKTGTLSWTEYCEAEMLRQQDENQKLQLELTEARRVIPILQKGYLEMLAEIDAYKTKIAQLELSLYIANEKIEKLQAEK